jgi:hypothetical protein
MLLRFWIFLSAIFLTADAFAQSGVGLRFASNVNYFPRARERGLVGGAFTTGVLGVFYSRYSQYSGFEAGLNISYKNGDDRGFPNLPVVMNDYSQDLDQNIGYTGLEMDVKVGPRFYAVYPRIGYVLGYRLEQSGFFRSGLSGQINRLYLMLPLGLSSNLPTRWGTVGFGGYYQIGILNVVNNPGSGSGTIYNGGRHRYASIEITVTYHRRD